MAKFAVSVSLDRCEQPRPSPRFRKSAGNEVARSPEPRTRDVQDALLFNALTSFGISSGTIVVCLLPAYERRTEAATEFGAAHHAMLGPECLLTIKWCCWFRGPASTVYGALRRRSRSHARPLG